MSLGYVLIDGVGYVVAVCRRDQELWLEKYPRPPGFVLRETAREELGEPTHSLKDNFSFQNVQEWFIDAFLPGHQGLLDNHNQELLLELMAEIQKATWSLRVVQVSA